MKIKKKWEWSKRKEFGGTSGWIRKKKKRKKIEERKNKKTELRERKKMVFRFSLRSTEIEPSVFVGARGKVHLRDESYSWVPKSRSFVKLQEVGNFPTLIIFSLKAI